jgi:hypothetical protein
MPTHALHRPSLSLGWLLATCLGACVGTPTPEPPDNLPRLPRPDDSRVFGPVVAVEVSSEPGNLPPIFVLGAPGAVQPSTQLWLVNLDSDAQPALVDAASDGSFQAEIVGQLNDRVRLVSRTDRQHSPALDAYVAVAGRDMYGLAALPPDGLPCLTIEPADDLETLVSSGADETRELVLTSRCPGPVALEAKLRFGNAGFAIDAPTSIPANGEAKLRLHVAGHDDAREHADVVLLDVSTGSQHGRYAVGVWSISRASVGSE